MLLLLAGLFNFLSNLLESVGDVCFLWRLINIRMDKAMDKLVPRQNGRSWSLHKSQSCQFFEQGEINMRVRNLGLC
jgi:hypothetical protein